MLAAGAVTLEDASDAFRCYPDLWPTADAARQAFHRARRVAAGGSEAAAEIGESHAPLRRAIYQRAGAGKRPSSLAFDPAVVPADDLRTWLKARVGPLARFEIEPAEPPPTLARSEPDPWPARFRLAGLAERLHAARPKREHGVRQLDWDAWQDAAREAVGMPSTEWVAWRAMIGAANAGI